MNKQTRHNLPCTTTISPEFKELAAQHNIKKSEALAVGMSILLAERGLRDYDNKLIVVRRLNMYKEEIQKKNTEITELLEKINKLTGKI